MSALIGLFGCASDSEMQKSGARSQESGWADDEHEDAATANEEGSFDDGVGESAPVDAQEDGAQVDSAPVASPAETNRRGRTGAKNALPGAEPAPAPSAGEEQTRPHTDDGDTDDDDDGDTDDDDDDGARGFWNSLSIFNPTRAKPAKRNLAPNRKAGGRGHQSEAKGSAVHHRSSGPNSPWHLAAATPRVLVHPAAATGSWGHSIALLRQGLVPIPERIRPQDFVNAPDYAYPAPDRQWASITADLAPAKNRSGTEILRLGVRLRSGPRDPVDVIFVVDASDRTPTLAIDAWRDLAHHACASLRPKKDRLTVVTITDAVRSTMAADFQRPFASVPTYAKGQASLLEGTKSAAKFMGLRKQRRETVVVIFATTTAVNEMTELRRLLGWIKERGTPVSLVTAVTTAHPDADFLSLARAGGGALIFVDENELESGLSQRRALTTVLMPQFADAEFDLRFAPRSISSYRLLGYRSRSSHAVDVTARPHFGSGQEFTFIFEIKRRLSAVGVKPSLGTIRVRGRAGELAPLLIHARVHPTLEQAPLSMRRAVVASSLAASMRGNRALIESWDRMNALAASDPTLTSLLLFAKTWTKP